MSEQTVEMLSITVPRCWRDGTVMLRCIGSILADHGIFAIAALWRLVVPCHDIARIPWCLLNHDTGSPLRDSMNS